MHCVYLRGAVNTQGFVWKFSCTIYTFSFIHSFVHSYVVETFTHLFVAGSVLPCVLVILAAGSAPQEPMPEIVFLSPFASVGLREFIGEQDPLKAEP